MTPEERVVAVPRGSRTGEYVRDRLDVLRAYAPAWQRAVGPVRFRHSAWATRRRLACRASLAR